MRTVWKFPLAPVVEQIVTVPKGAVAVDVHMQAGRPCIWALVDPDAQEEEWTVAIHGTGEDVDPRDHHLGTAHAPPHVWHVFRRIP